MKIARSASVISGKSLLAAVLFIVAACSSDDPESPQAKYEWSLLQTIEYSSRATPISVPEFKNEKEYELLCLPSSSGGRVWIMLKPTTTPYYKQMPITQFTISHELVNKLILERRVSDTVAYVLRIHETK